MHSDLDTLRRGRHAPFVNSNTAVIIDKYHRFLILLMQLNRMRREIMEIKCSYHLETACHLQKTKICFVSHLTVTDILVVILFRIVYLNERMALWMSMRCSSIGSSIHSFYAFTCVYNTLVLQHMAHVC